MKNKPNLTAEPNKYETAAGWFWLVFQLLLLPGLIAAVNVLLPTPMSLAEQNFAFYGINFLAVLWVFRDFLSRSATQVIRHPAWFLQAVILGAVAYFACAKGIDFLLAKIAPGFRNANDAFIRDMSKSSFYLMAIGTVILVPVAEECFYRGLVFRKLYGKSHVAAYLISMAVFSLIHIVGYIQSYTLWELLICFLQYLPAGLCLAWSYTKADTNFAPIVIHAIINAVGLSRLR